MKLKQLLLLIPLLLVGCSDSENDADKHTAKEWAMMEVENDYYQLDDDGTLLTHDVVTQAPSKESVDELIADGGSVVVSANGYCYVTDDGDGWEYYGVYFKHTLITEASGGIKECTYFSAIAWEDESLFKHLINNAFGLKLERAKFSEQQILDLDIGELTWN